MLIVFVTGYQFLIRATEWQPACYKLQQLKYTYIINFLVLHYLESRKIFNLDTLTHKTNDIKPVAKCMSLKSFAIEPIIL